MHQKNIKNNNSDFYFKNININKRKSYKILADTKFLTTGQNTQ